MTESDMEQRLKHIYPDCQVAVVDMTGNQSNFEVRISSAQLQKLSRVDQHKAVMKVFDDELKSGEVHALAIKPLKL